jgi:hypothetical protein
LKITKGLSVAIRGKANDETKRADPRVSTAPKHCSAPWNCSGHAVMRARLWKTSKLRWAATECMPPVRALEEARTARDGIEAMLRRAVESFSQPGKPRGCLLLLGATKCTPANKGPQEYLLAVRQQAPEAISGRLSRAVAEGDVSQNADTDAIAAFYLTVAHGLAIRASDGASRAHLIAAVDGAMAAWDGLTNPGSKHERSSADGRGDSAGGRKSGRRATTA